ncbi:MAG: phosphoribosyltransferase [Chloroflexi bacterium]|nr:phosphoribosyltransferase [Chloroflexota bacterium]MYF80442.1 phosphoribosyltransferase [Chloroflexota bacterium]MYI05002.1 phosphoribosyltransferase [Chloroflexota bacterium]
MPDCGRIVEIRSNRSAGEWTLIVTTRPSSMLDHFSTLLKRALPAGVDVRVGTPQGTILFTSSRAEQLESTRAFMELLRDSVTIDDEAVMSHALGVHWFADIKERSQLGDLVERAKDYGSSNPSDPAAVEQIQNATLSWLARHPVIRSVDAVAAIPGTQPKDVDLPATLADTISGRLGLRRLSLRSRNQRPQKGQSGSTASRARSLGALMNADRDAFGRRVLLVDDIYRSGNSMMAGLRALRRAGASTIICLAITKTARDCNGLPASVDNWPDELPETLEAESFDVPFC